MAPSTPHAVAGYTVQVDARGTAIVCRGARVRSSFHIVKRGSYAECKQHAERYSYPLHEAA